MIIDWRQQLRQPSLPFYFVLLAGYIEGGVHWPETRDAQLAALSLPYTAVASAHDMGDRLNTVEGDIHSRNKSILGQRLANIALTQLYDYQNIITFGPIISNVEFTDYTAVITFDKQAPENQRLHLSGTAECVACCNAEGSPITFFLSDNSIAIASVSVDANSYTVTASITSSPPIVALRINWEPYSECVVLNSADLPLLPATILRNTTDTTMLYTQ